MGFRVWGLEFRVEGLGLRVWGLGFRVEGLGLASALNFRLKPYMCALRLHRSVLSWSSSAFVMGRYCFNHRQPCATTFCTWGQAVLLKG